MNDVARMESKNGGFVLINLFGEQKVIKGKIKIVDFVHEHLTVIEQDKKEQSDPSSFKYESTG